MPRTPSTSLRNCTDTLCLALPVPPPQRHTRRILHHPLRNIRIRVHRLVRRPIAIPDVNPTEPTSIEEPDDDGDDSRDEDEEGEPEGTADVGAAARLFALLAGEPGVAVGLCVSMIGLMEDDGGEGGGNGVGRVGRTSASYQALGLSLHPCGRPWRSASRRLGRGVRLTWLLRVVFEVVCMFVLIVRLASRVDLLSRARQEVVRDVMYVIRKWQASRSCRLAEECGRDCVQMSTSWITRLPPLPDQDGMSDCEERVKASNCTSE